MLAWSCECLEPAVGENFGTKHICKILLEQEFWQETTLDRTTADSFDLLLSPLFTKYFNVEQRETACVLLCVLRALS